MADSTSVLPEFLCAWDLETTGVDVYSDRIVTAAIVILDRQGEVVQKFNWLVNPEMEIPEAASNIHGITNEVAATGMDSKEAVFQIMQKLDIYERKNIPAAGYNLSYDYTILRTEAERHGYRFSEPRTVIDAFIIDRQLSPYRKGKRTLSVVAPLYGVELGNAHEAEADCIAAGQMALKQMEIINLYPQEIHDKTVGYAKAQAASFQTYLRRSDPSAIVDGTWPVKAEQNKGEQE